MQGHIRSNDNMSSKMADAIRFLSMDAVQAANSGHPGMPMGMAEIATALWKNHLNHNLDMLLKWGYPYVFDAFRFHITLTGQINNQLADRLIPFLSSWLDPILEDPFFIKDLVLAGEDDNGQFHELLRRELRG